MQDRLFTITRPTGFQAEMRVRSHEELWDGMAAHGWPSATACGDARLAWHSGSLSAAQRDRDGLLQIQWTVRHGAA